MLTGRSSLLHTALGASFSLLFPTLLIAQVTPTAPAQKSESAPPAIAMQAPTASGGSFLELLHTFPPVPAGTHAFAGFHGKEVAYFEGDTLVGQDPASDTVKWKSESVGKVRRVWEMDSNVLLASEHLRLLDTTNGKTLWTYPLNCQSDSCASDVMAVSDKYAVIAGFAPKFNMLMLLDLASGRNAWTSWATTCPMKQVGVTPERIYVLCVPPDATSAPTNGATAAPGNGYAAPAPAIAQVLDLKTRRVIAQLVSPDAGFVAETGWYSSTHAFILGSVGTTRKLAVFDSATGAVLKRYTVKQDAAGEGPGFFISTDSARFIPWQVVDGAIALWGMEAATGAIAWNVKFAKAKLVGQAGNTLILTQKSRGAVKLVGVDLGTGQTRFERTLPHQEPGFTLQETRILVYGPGDRLFMVLEAATGVVLAVTQLATPPGADELTNVYFGASEEHAVLRFGTHLSLHKRKPFQRWLDSVSSALDTGNELMASQLLQPLLPFAEVAPEVNEARRQMTLFQLLNAEMKLRRKQAAGALEDGQKAMDWAGRYTSEDIRHLGPALLRFWAQCAWNCPNNNQRAEFLFDALMMLHARPADWGTSADVAGMAVLLARAVSNSDYGAEARNIIQEMHAKPELAASLEAHPYWLQFQLAELESLLDDAKSLLKDGDYLHAADALHKMAQNPTAGRAFDANDEAWLDAQSAYLLPADLMEERVPPLVSKLDKSFSRTRHRVLSSAEEDVCAESCRTAGTACHGKCVAPEKCAEATDLCVKSCKGRATWTPPEFNASPLSPTFFKCR